MSTDISSQRIETAPARRWWKRPIVFIVGLVLATVVGLQTIRPVDNGTTNGFTMVALFVGIVAAGVWLALFAPFERRARWLGVAGILAFGVLICRVVRIDGFDGNLRPIVNWRWSPNLEAELAARGLTRPSGAEPAKWFTTPHDFPGFLGPNRDAFIPDVQLKTDWEAAPPKLLWKQPIGAGYSAFSIVGNAAITLEQRGEQELVSCYEVETGKMHWFHSINARHSDVIGGDGPGSTPTVEGGRVYALGGTGVLRCLDGASGKEIWVRDVLADVGTNAAADHGPVPWGRSASPLVVDDLCVVPGGGPTPSEKISLVAYNKHDGKIVWKGGKTEVSYSSPSLANYGGVRQIVIVNEANITAHDPKTGEVLWEAPWEGTSSSSASASQTIQLADDRLFVSKGYSMGGAALFEIKRAEDGKWNIKKLWHNHRALMTKLNNVVTKDGFAYGLSDGVLQCVDLKDGKRRWAGDDYGHGQVLRIGNALLVMAEDGAVALVDLDPAAFRELAKFQALIGKTWNNPAISGNRLVVRNAQEAACFEVPLADEASRN
jgi:outer membrane protein assembly factor BamB